MRFKIEGADRDTARDVVLIIDARNTEAALRQASAAGIYVSQAYALQDGTAVSHWILLAIGGGVTALLAALILVSLLVDRPQTPVEVVGAAPRQERAVAPAPSRIAETTKRAWEQINTIEAQARGMRDSDAISLFRFNVTSYAQIDTDYIDAELRTYIQEWISTNSALEDAYTGWATRMNQIRSQIQDAKNMGAFIGRSNQQNPEGGAVAGALLLEMMGNAATQQQRDAIQAEFDAKRGPLEEKRSELARRQKEIGARLEQRYGMPFRKRL